MLNPNFCTFVETTSCACVTAFYSLQSYCWSVSNSGPKLMLINSHGGYIHGLFFTTLPKVIHMELENVMFGHRTILFYCLRFWLQFRK